MGLVRFMFSRSIPAYFWLGLGYAIFVAVIYATQAATGEGGDAADALPLNLRVEESLDATLLTLPLVSGAEFLVTGTTIFITFGFFCAWIEVVRATNIRNTAHNDTWSLIMTLIAFVLFIGVAPFGTQAFLIVALVGFGDVLLDRFVGQAVARRDFGGFPGTGGGE